MFDDPMFGKRGTVQYDMAQKEERIKELEHQLDGMRVELAALQAKNTNLLKLCMEIEEKYLSIERMRKEQ